MKHTCVYFLLLRLWWLFESNHSLNQLFDLCIYLIIFCWEYFLEMLVSSGIDCFGILTWLIVLWEEILALLNQFFYLLLCISGDLVIFTRFKRLKEINCQDQFIFSEMRSIKDGSFLNFKVFWLWIRKSLILLDEITCWNDYVILDVLNQCVDKWTSNVLDSATNPIIIMKEVSLSS